MTFNTKMLDHANPIFTGEKIHYFHLKNNNKSCFVKKIATTEKLWNDYFLNEINFYKLYHNFNFHNFKLPPFIFSDDTKGILALEFVEGSTLTTKRFVSDEELTFSQIDR